MKTIKLIEVNNILTPEKPIPVPNLGTLYDGKNVIVFETTEEAEQYTPVYDETNIKEQKILDINDEAQLKELKAKLAALPVEASQKEITK
jgi:hypothetical protein